MSENPKARGLQHLKNKSKYKNKSKITTPKVTPTQRNRSPTQLQDNWDRYEEDGSSTYQHIKRRGTDFSFLANAPISKGTHFEFKSDVDEKYSDSLAVDACGLFNLDLNLLGLSLSSIPFDERCSIPSNYFTADQQRLMQEDAMKNNVIYQQTCLLEKFRADSKKIGSLSDTHRSNKLGNISTETNTVNPKELFKTIPNPKIAAPDFSVDDVDSGQTNTSLQIDRLDEIEEEFDKMTLTKASSKVSDENKFGHNISTKPNHICGSSSDDIIHIAIPSGDRASVTSILETEDLEKWLDDVLDE